VVQPTDHGDDGAAHHDIVEVGDDEIGVVEVDVGGEGAEVEAGQTADGEDEDEAQSIEQWGW